MSPREPDHHAPRGGFRNPWSGDEDHSLGDGLRWARERRREGRVQSPPRDSLPQAAPDVAHPRAEADRFSATWIGHSTVLLQMDGLNVITDPVFSERASPVQWLGPRRVMSPGLALDDLPPLDAVLVSHNHYDHLDRPAVKRLAREHPRAVWVVPLRLAGLVRRWGAREVIELDWWETTDMGGLRVTSTPARHFSARGLWDRRRTLWSGYGIEAGGARAYFAGDTAYHPEFGEIASRCGPFDLVMMPIGAYDPRWFMRSVHCDPEEAVKAYLDLRDAAEDRLPLMLGIHWGTFRLTDEPMDEPPERALAEWRRCGLDPERLWIAAFGETRDWL